MRGSEALLLQVLPFSDHSESVQIEQLHFEHEYGEDRDEKLDLKRGIHREITFCPALGAGRHHLTRYQERN